MHLVVDGCAIGLERLKELINISYISPSCTATQP